VKVIITGTPGTGKSTIAEKLSEDISVEILDIKKLIRKIKAYRTNGNGEKEVIIPKFRNALKKELKNKKDWIIESHLLCEIKLNSDFVFVFRCKKNELEKRLKKRKYNKKKIEDNLMVELLDYCYLKSKNNLNGKLFELDTSNKSVKKCVLDLKELILGKREKLDSIDYSKELIDFVLKSTTRK